MGIAIARELTDRGADVTLVLVGADPFDETGMKVVRVTSATKCTEPASDAFSQAAITIMAAGSRATRRRPGRDEDQKKRCRSGSETETGDILRSLNQEETRAGAGRVCQRPIMRPRTPEKTGGEERRP